jgi:hypothetical protein
MKYIITPVITDPIINPITNACLTILLTLAINFGCLLSVYMFGSKNSSVIITPLVCNKASEEIPRWLLMNISYFVVVFNLHTPVIVANPIWVSI